MLDTPIVWEIIKSKERNGETQVEVDTAFAIRQKYAQCRSAAGDHREELLRIRESGYEFNNGGEGILQVPRTQ